MALEDEVAGIGLEDVDADSQNEDSNTDTKNNSMLEKSIFSVLMSPRGGGGSGHTSSRLKDDKKLRKGSRGKTEEMTE